MVAEFAQLFGADKVGDLARLNRTQLEILIERNPNLTGREFLKSKVEVWRALEEVVGFADTMGQNRTVAGPYVDMYLTDSKISTITKEHLTADGVKHFEIQNERGELLEKTITQPDGSAKVFGPNGEELVGAQPRTKPWALCPWHRPVPSLSRTGRSTRPGT
jgi:hypothetical protein